MLVTLFLYFCVFFFCKQKTAYELRISDWSSDVCSSDLVDRARLRSRRAPPGQVPRDAVIADRPAPHRDDHDRERGRDGQRRAVQLLHARHGVAAPPRGDDGRPPRERADPQRSEEHTSELQSLMRTSYAVFCLNKQTNKY